MQVHSDIFCLISEPLSSVSSLEVHFDLLDLTELTDMSDQELGEVFADSDEENQTESPASDNWLITRSKSFKKKITSRVLLLYFNKRIKCENILSLC
uniref:Dysbindin domain-containing protein 1 n=1 Tax=Sinocyclocheilus rhinocerous TaxID=307959 RepID=A0A673H069_9TELE